MQKFATIIRIKFGQLANRYSVICYLRKYHRKINHLTILLIVCLFSISCANRIKQSIVSGIVDDFTTATKSHNDPLLVEYALPPLLLAIDAFLVDQPSNIKLLTQAIEAYASYGALVEMRDRKRAIPIYNRAHNYGKRALKIYLNQENIHLLPFKSFEEKINNLNTSDLKMIYWCATAWGGWINSNLHSMNAIAELPKVIALMKWVVKTDESFNNGSAHLFLGVFYSALPKMLGGDPNIALHHFEKNIEITQNRSLLPFVLMAEYYTRQIFDRKLHDELLDYVIDYNVPDDSANELENKISKQRAFLLMDNADDFF